LYLALEAVWNMWELSVTRETEASGNPFQDS
jgi:hypothetical protein